LRQQVPEFFALPACHYLSDRGRFHEYYDQIQQLLFYREDLGIGATESREGWLPFFLSAVIMNDLLRACVTDSIGEIATRLVPYTKLHALNTDGHLVFEYALKEVLGLRSLADQILSELDSLTG